MDKDQPKILLVDDDRDFQEMLTTVLQNAGFQVESALSGLEALSILEKSVPDIIVLDVIMPEMSGWEVCKRIKDNIRTAVIPVMMLTLKEDFQDKITSLQVEADDYITKPFDHKELIQKLQELIVRKKTVVPSEATTGPTATDESLLVDKVTGLQTIPLLIDKIRNLLERDKILGIICLDIESYSGIEEAFGFELYDELLKIVVTALDSRHNPVLEKEDIVAINRINGDVFYIFVTPKTSQNRIYLAELEELGYKLGEYLSSKVESSPISSSIAKLDVSTGYTTLEYNPVVRMERLIYKALREAMHYAMLKKERDKGPRVEMIREIIAKKYIRVLFQPIISLADEEVFGYEVLSRGPENTIYENPDFLFKLASQKHLVWHLSVLCLEKVREYINKMSFLKRIFMNIDPFMLADPRFKKGDILKDFVNVSSKIILEITERKAISDFLVFTEAIDNIRRLGYKIAIDDAGSGYASLQAIAELKPDFVKISIPLVRDLDQDLIKQNLVKMLVDFCKSVGCLSIAEGIESPAEKKILLKLGVDYGQGFLFQIPKGYNEI